MSIQSNSMFENSLFFLLLLSKEISFDIPLKFLKFEIHFPEDHSEGSMSRTFFI